jgi:uncharacterized membrane protein
MSKGTGMPRSEDVWLPPANELANYPPAFVDGILEMARSQQAHRHELEKRESDAIIALKNAEARIEARGQQFGLLIGIVALVIGGVLGWKGSQWSASVIGGGGVMGLVTAFLRGSSRGAADKLPGPEKGPHDEIP